MAYTAKEVEDLINETNEEVYNEETDEWTDTPWQDYGDPWMEMFYEPKVYDIAGLGNITVVESAGAEGDGAAMSIVIEVGDQYFKKEGVYSSWGESTLDGDLYEVKPMMVSVTQYLRK